LEALYGPGHGLDDFLSWLGLGEDEIDFLRCQCAAKYARFFAAQLGALLNNRRLFGFLLLRYGLTGLKPLTLEQVGAFYGLSEQRIAELQDQVLGILRDLRGTEEFARAGLLPALEWLGDWIWARRWLPRLGQWIDAPAPPGRLWKW